MNFHKLAERFSGLSGIEIGGPSNVFQEDIPIYRQASLIDGCNFSEDTVWSTHGAKYEYFPEKNGNFILSDGTSLPLELENKYDFLLASHCLEHIANPIKALKEWKRVIRPGGALLIIVPNKTFIFDRHRETVSLQHLLVDYARDTQEDDLSHLDEILEKHDLSLDPAAGSFEEFRTRSLDNYRNRCLHHHVFDLDIMDEIFALLDLEILFSDESIMPHIIVEGIKS